MFFVIFRCGCGRPRSGAFAAAKPHAYTQAVTHIHIQLALLTLYLYYTSLYLHYTCTAQNEIKSILLNRLIFAPDSAQKAALTQSLVVGIPKKAWIELLSAYLLQLKQN